MVFSALICQQLYSRLSKPISPVIKVSICLLAAFSSLVASPVGDRHLIIATGSEGNPYHQSGQQIAEWFNAESERAKMIAMITDGSVDNIARLREQSVDLAIAQRDTLTTAYYDVQNPLGDIEVILPLFPEALQIFVRGRKGTIGIDEFREMLASGQIDTLGIGAPGTTTHTTTRKILGTLNVHVPEEVYDLREPSLYLEDFAQGEIGAAAYFAAMPIESLQVLSEEEAALVTFSGPELSIIESHLKKLEPIPMDIRSYAFTSDSGMTATLPGTWAFLVGRQGIARIIEKDGAGITDTILRNASQATDAYIHPTFSGAGAFRAKADGNDKWAVDYQEHKTRFFQGLPASKELRTLLNIRDSRPYYLLIIGLAILLPGIWLLRKYPKNKWKRWWKRYRYIPYGIPFFLLIVIGVPPLIFAIETRFCEANSLTSPILNLPYWERYTWLFVLSVTGYESQLFPLSRTAKVLASACVYLSYSIIIFGTAYIFMKEQLLKKRKQGLAPFDGNNHIVICGWNESAEHLVTSILETSKTLFERQKQPDVVVLYPAISMELGANTTISSAMEGETPLLRYIDGEARDPASLAKAKVHDAKTVLLLADNSSADADNRTLVRALAISRHCRKQRKSESKTSGAISGYEELDVYTIAELNDPTWKESLYANDINEVICAKEMGDNVILQSVFNHGISRILDRLLTYDEAAPGTEKKQETNEFYIIDLKDEPGFQHFVGKTFDELSPILREKDVLLMGIKAAFYDESGHEIIDEETVAKLISSKTKHTHGMQLSKQIMINPIGEDRKYVTDKDDQLFVIALDRKKVDQLKSTEQL